MDKTGKLIVWLLTEILENQIKGKGSKDHDEYILQTIDLIREAITGGHFWALELEMSGVFSPTEGVPENVRTVMDVLEMWEAIERGFERLSDSEKEQIEKEVSRHGKNPQFRGFDGNSVTESEYNSIAHILVDKLGRYEYFKGREFNSHLPMLDQYKKMLPVFGLGGMRGTQCLSAEAIIRLLKSVN
jgi:uncharacterized protein YfbU (UPF0304 family)